MRNPYCLLLLSILLLGPAIAIPQRDANAAPQQNRGASGHSRSGALNQQGLAALEKNKTEEAETVLRRAVQSDPQNLTAVYNLAGVLSFNKKKDEAMALLEKYAAQSPSDVGLLVRYGDLLFSSGKTKEAVIQYERGFAIDRNYVGLTSRLGLTYALTNRLDESEQMYLAAAKAEPKNGEILGNLASILLSLGKVDQALSTAKEAVALAPKKETFITLGSAYEAKKEFKAALESFKRAEQLGAKSDELKEKLNALTKLVA
ncbi:MAG: hypothetical protein EBZ48_03025 [Proteobacteria bacterium]|nr:hypothetical protein [Pseudomonadota bacterium]